MNLFQLTTNYNFVLFCPTNSLKAKDIPFTGIWNTEKQQTSHLNRHGWREKSVFDGSYFSHICINLINRVWNVPLKDVINDSVCLQTHLVWVTHPEDVYRPGNGRSATSLAFRRSHRRTSSPVNRAKAHRPTLTECQDNTVVNLLDYPQTETQRDDTAAGCAGQMSGF